MHIISKLLAAIAAWMNTVDEPVDRLPSRLDWWDLPPHHPQ
jgi:hypothetical protein